MEWDRTDDVFTHAWGRCDCRGDQRVGEVIPLLDLDYIHFVVKVNHTMGMPLVEFGCHRRQRRSLKYWAARQRI